MDFIIAYQEVEKILSFGVEIGYQRAMEDTGVKSQYMSQNKAWKRYKRCRITGWVEAGLLQRKTGGNGKGSTVFYETARLMTLDAANAIVIRKSTD